MDELLKKFKKDMTEEEAVRIASSIFDAYVAENFGKNPPTDYPGVQISAGGWMLIIQNFVADNGELLCGGELWDSDDADDGIWSELVTLEEN